MNNKQLIIDRLEQLKVESGQGDKIFKQTLASITNKTPRTIRRWFSLESNIHDSDIELIARHFGKHAHWLRYGDKANILTAVDQIMASDHFGVVIIKDNKVEETNFKFIEMMGLFDKDVQQEDVCDYILRLQTDKTVDECLMSNVKAFSEGVYVNQMVMLMGDGKEHHIESTTLNLNNSRILKIILDKGLVDGDTQQTPDNNHKQSNGEDRLSILFVDDDPIQCKLYKKMLSIHDCNVNTFNSSVEALNEFKDNHDNYDLIISDIIMPEMTGDKLAVKCRQIKPEIPFILCSGYAEHLKRGTAEEFGVSYYLQKPIDSVELLDLLNTLRQPA